MSLAALLLLIASAQEVCQPNVDCDGDGYSPLQGDCDDTNPEVHPGAIEDCGNDLDDDCDNLFNEGCDRGPQQGQLWGGSACYGEEDASFAVLMLPLLGLRRRR